MDKDGNAVAVTYTLNTTFGTGIVAGESGILLNNQMDDFSAKPGVPNVYGLVGGDANAVGPNKRPLSPKRPMRRVSTISGCRTSCVSKKGLARIRSSCWKQKVRKWR